MYRLCVTDCGLHHTSDFTKRWQKVTGKSKEKVHVA